MRNLMKKIDYEDEKGAITLFVLTAIIFFIVVISGIYINISNKGNSQNKDIDKIEKDYVATNDDMNNEYDSLFMKENTTKTDLEGNKYIIPAGFRETGEADKVKDGIVIQDKTGNEFVWVPVENPISDTEANATTNKAMAVNLGTEAEPKYRGLLYNFSGTNSTVISGSTTTTSLFREPDMATYADDNTTYLNTINTILGTNLKTGEDFKTYSQNEYNEIVKSIIKNKGFYVGRYESSLNGTKIQSKKGVLPVSANNSLTKMWYGLYAKQNKYVEDNGLTSIKSSMIYGSQYDAMLNWALTGVDKVKVTAIGNANHNYGSVQNTGAESRDKINNIYDLESNIREWTAESANTGQRTIRGGGFAYTSNSNSRSGFNTNDTYNDFGSRIILYM